jgi:ABC-type branched-subunit amino acid transport system substrate-binding protein
MAARIVLLLLGLSLVLCGGVSVHAEEIKLRVGVISGLTGAAAKWSRFQNNGMVLAQEELQSEGVQIELLFEDAQTSAPKVITAFNKLVQLNKVDAVIADDFGFVIAPILELTERRKIPLIACGLPQEHYCAQAPRYFFSVGSQVPRSIAAYERFFELHPEVKRIGLVVFDDPEWGNQYLALWREITAKRGVTIVDTFLNNEWQPDFKSALTRMIPKKPQAILFAHEPEGMIKAARQLRFAETIVAANNILEMLADSSAARPELEGVYLVDIANC